MRHLIDPTDLSVAEIGQIIALAEDIIANRAKYSEACKGKKLATLFYEPSTRTRLSFTSAMLELGGSVIGFSDAASSSVSKGETVADTVRVIRCFADIIAMRHFKEGAPLVASQYAGIPVIIAGDGINEHPTQALLDLCTMREKFGRIEGLKVAILGDIKHSRVAKSNLFALAKLGAEVRMYAPETLIPKGIDRLGAKLCTSREEAVEGADVVMGLRIQLERQQAGNFPSLNEYAEFYGVNERVLSLASPDAIVMHPGPVNRGVELTSDVIDDGKSRIEDQVLSGVAVRMAILFLLEQYRKSGK